MTVPIALVVVASNLLSTTGGDASVEGGCCPSGTNTNAGSTSSTPMLRTTSISHRPRLGVINHVPSAIVSVISFFTGSLQIFLVGGKKCLKRRRVELPLGSVGAEHALEVTHRPAAVEDFDLLDQPVEAQAHGGVRNPIRRGEILQRAGGEEEAFDKREVLVIQFVQPGVYSATCHSNR